MSLEAFDSPDRIPRLSQAVEKRGQPGALVARSVRDRKCSSRVSSVVLREESSDRVDSVASPVATRPSGNKKAGLSAG